MAEHQGTTLRQLATIALRLIAVYIVARAVTDLPQLALILSGSTASDPDNLGFSLAFVLSFATGIVLWFIANKLANAMVQKTDSVVISEGSNQLVNIEVIALSVLGVFIFANTFPFLLADIAELIIPFNRFTSFRSFGSPPASFVLGVIGSGLRVALAVWLVFGSKGIVRWIRRTRDRARYADPDEYDE